MSIASQNHMILGDVAPDFTANSSTGRFQLYEYLGDSWGILFSHPKDHTPVCTTELARAAELQRQWNDRNVKICALSCDSVESHVKWIDDINDVSRSESVSYPIIADESRRVASLYGMLDQTWMEADMPLTVRSVFIIAPDKRIKLIMTYPASVGRNFDEILRVVDSLQLSEVSDVVTPADWKPKQDVIVPPDISDSEASRVFGTFAKVKPYLRWVRDPSCL